MHYHSKSSKEVLKELESGQDGLDENIIKKRKQLGNINKIETEKKQGIISKFFAQFKDLMVIVLLVSAVLSIAISIASKEYQNLFEGGIIIFIVILNATFGVVQEHKAENALENLKKQTLPYCEVLRGGKHQKVKVEDLTIGDVVVLSSGNIVPADLRLIETHNFKVDESALTGESLAVEKKDRKSVV